MRRCLIRRRSIATTSAVFSSRKTLFFHARTKHIEVHYHFVREQVLFGEVELTHVLTNRQIADIFTKALGLDKLRQFSGAPGLRHLDVPNLRGRVEPEPEPEPEMEREPEPEPEADRPQGSMPTRRTGR
jgi:hypothetical protein